MLINWAGLLLAFSVILHLWFGYYLIRMRLGSFLFPLYLYLNLLLGIIEFSTILLLQENVSRLTASAFNIRFVAEAFIPPVLFLLNQNYSFGTNLPRISMKSLGFFAVSLILSIMAISGYLTDGYLVQSGMVYPRFTSFYWLFILYFYLSLYQVLSDFVRRYRLAKRKSEIANLKHLINLILPLLIFSFACLHFLPFWGIIHPALFLFYFVISWIVVYISFRWNILDIDDYVYRSIAFFALLFSFFLLWAFFLPPAKLWVWIAVIPSAFVLFYIINRVHNYLQRTINQKKGHETYDLEEELETFTGEIGKFIHNEDLSRFVADFSRKILRCTKCAVITTRFDVSPYEIEYLDGFEKNDIRDQILNSSSPVLEELEAEHLILNRQDLPGESRVFQAMNRMKMYLAIPLVNQSELLGFVLLGDDRKSLIFHERDIRFARLLSVQVANALKNIHAIQNTLQTQKMADLGVVASQLAHDFQSFITLVKLDTPEKGRIREHAIYVEKLVQDLLNYARPQDLKLLPVNINQLIDMTFDLVDINSNIMIEKRYSENLPEINLDSNQMRRVFLNLFENSIRAMKPNGGRLKITTRPLRPLSKRRHNPWIYVEILDEGAGIPLEFLEKIFEPFFTTHKNQGGNGMGLAIVKQIISRHKGFIDVTSKEGKGTIFNIRLPYLI